MFINQLDLTDFRSYSTLELPLNNNTHIFLGENGEGKTNIIEAVMFLALLSSHRTSTTAPLIKLGKERAYIRTKITEENRTISIEIEINNGRANRVKVNQNPVRSQREIAGIVKAICFSPEDLDLVRGDPSERRTFLDHLIVQKNPRLSAVITDFDRALKQRNSLLKARAPQSSLEPWDGHLINFGSELLAARLNMVESLIPYFQSSYNSISSKKKVGLGYKSSIEGATTNTETNRTLFTESLSKIRNQERERGLSLIGPHRDDLLLNLEDQPVKGYASHGESWSVALSLRLASFYLMRAEGAKPILILDDVFSELDERRRESLAKITKEAEQSLITVAVANDLPKEIVGERYLVTSGKVSKL